MARFIDLDDEDSDAPQDASSRVEQHIRNAVVNLPSKPDQASSRDDDVQPESQRPRISNAITRAFACYPILHTVISHLDLITLDALSRTTYYIHSSLIQNRSVLLTSTLRCSNEHLPVDRDEALRYRARAGNWYYMEDGRGYNGKAGDCARDLVGECRRCGDVVCRNCIIKPPAQVTLKERHRRLCLTCTRAPIPLLAKPPLPPTLSLASEPVQRAICQCTKEVWLCQPCGRSIRATDSEYQRIWRWRSHYGEVLGGLGTGIGDGDRGVICGREGMCLNAKERETEIDCDAADLKDHPLHSWAELSPSNSNSSTPENHLLHNPLDNVSTTPHTPSPLENAILQEERTPSPQIRCGYERHEIEGIGGVVKRKLVQMVRVGACVPEWEDERGPGKRALQREVNGTMRSWCGWCWRVIPGQDDH